MKRHVTYKGIAKTLPEWCRELGLVYDAMNSRINVGWTPERAFETPVRYRRTKAEIEHYKRTVHPSRMTRSERYCWNLGSKRRGRPR